jgi:hypothetical protein
MKLVFDEKTNSWAAEADPAESTEKAEMGLSIRGTVDKVAGLDFMGVPIGGPVLGGAIAIAIDRVLLEKVDPTHKYAPWSLVVAGILAAKLGPKLSPALAKWTSGILLYEAAADTISSLMDKYWPTPGSGTTTTTTTEQAQPMRQGQFQSPSTQGDYYAKAFGRN